MSWERLAVAQPASPQLSQSPIFGASARAMLLMEALDDPFDEGDLRLVELEVGEEVAEPVWVLPFAQSSKSLGDNFEDGV